MALTHPEWDLSSFSRVDSDYWYIEALAKDGDPVAEVGTDPTEGARETQEEVVVVDDEPAA